MKDLKEYGYGIVNQFDVDFSDAVRTVRDIYGDLTESTIGRKLIYDLLDEIRNEENNTGNGMMLVFRILDIIEEMTPELYHNLR
jgi:hypothetical protein